MQSRCSETRATRSLMWRSPPVFERISISRVSFVAKSAFRPVPIGHRPSLIEILRLTCAHPLVPSPFHSQLERHGARKGELIAVAQLGGDTRRERLLTEVCTVGAVQIN